MFSKKNRLSKDRDVQYVARKGRSFFDPHITVKAVRSAETSRFTVVVSTKVSKSAVKRNRIKRVLREFLRLHIADIIPADYMIIVRPTAAKFTTAQLLATIEGVFQRNKLLRKK